MSYQDTSIINGLIAALETRLKDILITGVSDATKAGLVRPGKLQDDPTIAEINILIHTGDDSWPHEININPSGLQSPAYATYSGLGTFSTFIIRRFIVELELFFDNEIERVPPQMKANIILSRAESAIQSMTNFPGTDSFGETAYAVQVKKSFIREGGGEGTFIWRGKIWVEFLTERDHA